MVPTIDNRACRCTLFMLVLLLLCPSVCFADHLSDKQRGQLIAVVKKQYHETMMEGTTIHRLKRKNIVVTIVGVKKTPNSQRVAQVKATRNAGEFLQGAVNHSVTVYETIDNSAYSIADVSAGGGMTENSTTSSAIEQNSTDMTCNVMEERFSDKSIQSSLTKVKQMQPLCKIYGDPSQEVYAFYIILE